MHLYTLLVSSPEPMQNPMLQGLIVVDLLSDSHKMWVPLPRRDLEQPANEGFLGRIHRLVGPASLGFSVRLSLVEEQGELGRPNKGRTHRPRSPRRFPWWSWGASRQNTRGAVIDSGGPTSDRHGELIFV